MSQSQPSRARVVESVPVTAEERDAKQRYRSPRLLQLWHERRAQGAAAVARFVTEMEGQAPLVEPIEGNPRGDVLITFAGRFPSETRDVWLFGGPATGLDEVALRRFEDTDLRYVTVHSPHDARFAYGFRAGEPRTPISSHEERIALIDSLQADPWNPRRQLRLSLVDLPGAPPQPFITRRDDVPAGSLVTRTLHSEILEEDRNLGVYLPPGFDPAREPYPYAIVFDGQAYGTKPDSAVPTPVILDNLIAQGKVPPMLAVLVDNGPGTRDRDLPMSAPFGELLARELAPWVQREYHAAADPAKVTLAGSSFGGLCAAYVAFHHPDVFGNVLSQSGSFWYSPGALSGSDAPYEIETGALMREIVEAPRMSIRWWMEVGKFESGGPGLPGSDQLGQNRHMRDVLRAKGYPVSYHEFAGGHDYACWRGSLADGLMALVGEGWDQR